MGLTSKVKTLTELTLKRPKGWRSLIWNSAMHNLKKAGPLMAPVHISIEPTNVCNARCPVCETGKGDMKRKNGFLDEKKYYRFIDDIAPTTNSMMYYFMGEPFMHKHAYEMIRYAREKGIYVESCTNGDFIDAKGIIYSDINKISFQLGGMDNATHQRYRIRSDLDKALSNLYELIEERKKNPNSNVQIDVGFIVMRHNEHQVHDFLKWAEEIGVDTANVVDPCVRNMFEGHAYLPKDRKYWYYDEQAFEQGILKPKLLPDNQCIWVWNSLQLNWDGTAVPCCRDTNGENIFGNVFEEGLIPVWNSEKAIAFREKILTSQGNVGICQLCSGYSRPNLTKGKPPKFKIEHHSTNDDLPTHEEAMKEASNVSFK